MSRWHLSPYSTRLKNSLVALLFVGTQVVFPLTLSGIAHAASYPSSFTAADCTVDTAGANDVPGQKDLNMMCADTSALPTSEHIAWNWDELGTTGNNSMDACALFDTNGNGNADYSACVTTNGTPATYTGLIIYSCSDTATDKCFNSTATTSPYTSSCTISETATDPFSNGTSSPNDTTADCTFYLSEVGGESTASLIDVCSYPSSVPNSDPSDCVVAVPGKAKLEVVKDLSPSTDAGLFDLKIDGTTYATGVGNGGSTGEQIVVVKNTTHSVSEAANASSSTTLSAYSSNIVCKDLHGTGTTVASGSGTSLSNITLAADSDVVCTITNTRLTGSITLIKSVQNDHGGTAGPDDFGLSIGGTSVNSGDTLTLNPGSYSINEAGRTGYQFVSLTGTGCPAALGGNVTLTANQSVTCTITNSDIAPSLTVIKDVTNDNGGSAQADAFTLRVNGTALTNGTLSNNNLTDTYTYSSPVAGTAYTISEDSFTGYNQDSLACTDNSSGQDVGNPVTLSLGQSVTCTVTNNDTAPKLTLVKNVTNDNGGTDTADQWTLEAQHATDTPVINQTGTPSNNGTVATTATVSVAANTAYALSESGPSGYSASSWQCTAGSLSGSSLTLSPGDNATCTITNNDIAPVLTVTKVVTNDNGGTLQVSDFPLYVNNMQVTSGTQYTFNAGQYTVSETQQTGYTLDSISGDCLANGSITLQVGGVYSCTLTNNDVPATITVTKVVNNNHGGTAGVSDFALYVGATQVTSGAANTFNAGQQYTISETALVNGYHQDSLVCTDTDTKADLTATFTPTLGEHIACTITNSDVAPQLTVIKHVVNDNGGTAVAGDFTMSVTGTNVSNGSFAGAESPGTTVTLNAGSYSVDEGTHTGYSKMLGQDCSGSIDIGETKTCVITNDDIAPTLTVVKNVVNDNGGNNTADSFTVKVNGAALTGGTLSNNNLTDTYTYHNPVAGTNYTVSEADPTTGGYTQTGLVCTDNDTRSSVSNPVNLSPGQNVTCVIINNDVAPTLTVVKNVTNDNGGNNKANDFTVKVNGTALTGGTLSNNNLTDTYTYSNALANTSYTVSEDSVNGYHQDSLVCTDNTTKANVSNPVSLNEGQNVTCVITNNDVAPTLTVIKDVVNDNGGSAKADSFTVKVNGSQLSGGTLSNSDLTDTYTYSNALANTAYTVSETDPTASGYAQTSLVCTDTGTKTTVNNPVTLNEGQNVTCVITNNDIAPQLTVIKHVVNGYGGTAKAGDFTMGVTGTNVSDSSFAGAESPGTTVTLNAGTYSIGESGGPSGYTASTTGDCSGTISVGESKTCTITNTQQPGTISGHKYNVDATAVSGDGTGTSIQNWTVYLLVNGQPIAHTTTAADGSYSFTGLDWGDYTLGECLNASDGCDTWTQIYGPAGATLNGSQLSSVNNDFGNFQNASISGYKFDDVNGNGSWDTDTEGGLQGWTIVLEGPDNVQLATTTTAKDGSYSFTNVAPNTDGYEICEERQSGWTPTHPDNTGCQTVYVILSGHNYANVDFGNYPSPALNITKSNNQTAPGHVNDQVKYTIEVTVPDTSGVVNNVTVTDLPPANFTVDPSSIGAFVTHSDNSVTILHPDPNYGSPGIWQLGTLYPGDVATLFYIATIGNVADGTYPDAAFATGTSALGNSVLAGCTSACLASQSTFVGTQVSVISPLAMSTFTAPQVLGAAVLVNTGTNLLAWQYIFPILMVGLTYITRRMTAEKGGK